MSRDTALYVSPGNRFVEDKSGTRKSRFTIFAPMNEPGVAVLPHWQTTQLSGTQSLACVVYQ